MTIEFIESKNRSYSNDILCPLVVIYANAGSQRSSLIEYSSVWTLKGFNTLIYNPPLNSNSILFYRNGVKEVNDFIIRYFDDNPHYSRILSFHVIAGGASHLGYHLRLLNENKKFNFVLGWIKAVVIDSGPCSTSKTISKIYKKDLVNSGNFTQYLLSFCLPIFIPFWMYYEKYDYPYLISCNNNWHYLVIYNENDDHLHKESISFIKTLKQKGNQFNEKNNDSDIMLFEKKAESQNDYIDSTNQLIDLIIYNNSQHYINNKLQNHHHNNIQYYNNNNNNITVFKTK